MTELPTSHDYIPRTHKTDAPLVESSYEDDGWENTRTDTSLSLNVTLRIVEDAHNSVKSVGQELTLLSRGFKNGMIELRLQGSA